MDFIKLNPIRKYGQTNAHWHIEIMTLFTWPHPHLQNSSDLILNFKSASVCLPTQETIMPPKVHTFHHKQKLMDVINSAHSSPHIWIPSKMWNISFHFVSWFIYSYRHNVPTVVCSASLDSYLQSDPYCDPRSCFQEEPIRLCPLIRWSTFISLTWGLFCLILLLFPKHISTKTHSSSTYTDQLPSKKDEAKVWILCHWDKNADTAETRDKS